MLTPKNKALLISLSNKLKPSFTLGKGEIDKNVIATLDHALSAHELVKGRILNNSSLSTEEAGLALAKATKSEFVTSLGHIMIFYRPKKDHPVIILD